MRNELDDKMAALTAVTVKAETSIRIVIETIHFV